MIPRAGRAFPLTTSTTLPDAAVTIATAFNREGLAAVLTGEAASAIHTRDRLRCRSLNYSLTPPVSASRLVSALRHLGFVTEGSPLAHLDAGFRLALTEAPLVIGRNDPIVAQTMQLRNGFVRVLSPTDCCREWLVQWRVTQADGDLERAIDVATCCDVNLPAMRVWMRKEQITAAWPAFKKLVDRARAQPAARVSRPL
ncbi:MAG: hypothetical protein M3Q55_04785 [Acidobacteriota bacterium]|nr:hypothetical protein [Acidobacteriota bacterium]